MQHRAEGLRGPLDVKRLRASHRGMRFLVPVLATSSMILSGCESAGPAGTMPVTVEGRTFHCRISADDASRQQGLGGVASLAPDEGMIFAFPDAGYRNFWMRGCVMALDIAFIDPAGFVTAVHTMPFEDPQGPDESESDYFARLVRYPSIAPAQFALEVAPGTLAPLGVKRGTRVHFDRDALKTLAE